MRFFIFILAVIFVAWLIYFFWGAAEEVALTAETCQRTCEQMNEAVRAENPQQAYDNYVGRLEGKVCNCYVPYENWNQPQQTCDAYCMDVMGMKGVEENGTCYCFHKAAVV